MQTYCEVLLSGDAAALLRDEDAAAEMERRIERITDPDVEVTLFGPAYSGIRESRRGIDGLRTLWRDWLKPFHSYRIEVEELVDLGERVLALTRGRATIEPGSPEIVNTGATLYTVRDGRISIIESYFDRSDGMRAAGLADQGSEPG